MMKNVSVIVPVYNASRWAESMVVSIKTNMTPVGELILVNDGEDGDFDKLVKIIRESVDITLYSFTTGGGEGPAIARNIGINNSSCKFIAFLDCDDQWLPGSLERRIDMLNKSVFTPFIYSSYYRISLDGEVTNITKVPAVADISMLLVTNFIATPSVVARRASIGEMRFRQIGHEDYDFWLRLIRYAGFPAIGLTEPVINVRTTSGSVSSVKKNAASWHYKILKANEIPLILRLLLFFGYSINGLLKRKIYEYRPLFFGLNHINNWWFLRHKNLKVDHL
jgi:teichuronic acid biosynthesis glycosyltransferase TuaG